MPDQEFCSEGGTVTTLFTSWRNTPRSAVLPSASAACLLLLFGAISSGYSQTQADRERIEAITKPAEDFSRAEKYETRSAGSATVFETVNANSFSHPSANISFEREARFRVGNGIFRKIWVSSPSSTKSSDGLGPLFNARSCQRCHLKDGRGRPPEPEQKAESMVLRVSIPPQSEEDKALLKTRQKKSIPDPVYGGQLQNFSIQGFPAEGEMEITYREYPVQLADGEIVKLRKPHYKVAGLAYGQLHNEAMLSPRVAPPVIGMGFLESISEREILALEDPDDRNGDGISGKTNIVWSDEFNKRMLGRFGWKSGNPTIVQQAASAFRVDMGISTLLYPNPFGDCSVAQHACLSAHHGGDSDEHPVEVNAELFDLLVFYTRNLGVPARRDVENPQVLEGKRLFYKSNCIGCHHPKFVTRRDSIGEEQSFQLIWPYSDLLLHDMGEGLADGSMEGIANGREWRTPPLWGIGLTEAVNGHTFFLHDGRARNLLEAILWHGGEAESSKQMVMAMTRAERDALIAFLDSL